MMKKILKVLILVIPTLIAATYFFLRWPYSTSHSQYYEFPLNENFDTVRKTFVRTPAKYKALEANGATIVSQNWDKMSVGFDRVRNPNWLVDGSGIIELNVKNPHFTANFRFNVKVDMNPNSMVVHYVLMEPVDVSLFKLQTYDVILTMSRAGERTTARIDATIGIQVKVPNLPRVHREVDDRLVYALERTLISTGERLPEIIDKYKDKKFIDITKRANNSTRKSRFR